MNVLFFMSTDDSLGGARSLLELVQELQKHGIEITVVNPFHNHLNDKLDEMGIENFSAGYQLCICRKDCGTLKFILKYVMKYLRYIACYLLAIKKIDKHLDIKQYDIIHTNNSVEDIGGYFSRKYNIPHVWHIREFGDEDFNFKYFHIKIGRYISDHSNIMIAISQAVKDSWVKKGAAADKITVITHGVNPENIIVTENSLNSPIKMIFAGAILPGKNQLSFVRAISELPLEYKKNICLDIYGTGDANYIDEIKRCINENDMNDIIHLKGFCNNIHQILKDYQIGIVNSKSEAMGRVTIEYMFAGLCVFASNRGANPELLNYGEAGVLFDYDDLKSIKTQLITLLENPDKINEYGMIARNRALRRYSILNNVEKIIDIYNEQV